MTSEPASELWLDVVLGDEGIAAVTSQVRRLVERDAKAKVKSVAMLDSAIRERLASGLHVDVLDLLAEGWNKAVELDDCRERSRRSPLATMIVTVGEHSISRDVKPEIVISYSVQKRFPLAAGLTVAGTFEGIELAFKGGKIISVGSGRCAVSVQFKLKAKEIGKPWVLKRWNLPGEHRFDPPLALPA